MTPNLAKGLFSDSMYFFRIFSTSVRRPGWHWKFLTQRLRVERPGRGRSFFCRKCWYVRRENERKISPFTMSSSLHFFALFVLLTKILAWEREKDFCNVSRSTSFLNAADVACLLNFRSSVNSFACRWSFLSRNKFRRCNIFWSENKFRTHKSWKFGKVFSVWLIRVKNKRAGPPTPHDLD